MERLKKVLQNKKKISIYASFVVALLLAYTLGASSAFYVPELGEASSRDVGIELKTLDRLTFDVDGTFSFSPLTASNFTQNITTSDTATAKLVANNYRASDTYHYYLYYVADSPFAYTDTTNHQAEVLLQIYYNGTLVTNSNASSLGLDLSEVTYKTSTSTSGSVSGWDVTGTDFVTIVNNKTFSAAKEATVTDTFEVNVVFVKLSGIDQSYNYNKTYTASLIMQEAAETDPSVAYSNSTYTVCQNVKCSLNELYYLYQ